MKTYQILFILVFGIMTSAFSQDFYDINTVNTIEITFEESNWDYLLDQLAAAGNEERLMGTATINGQVFDSVGVRYKGNSSYNPNQVKNPFNIKLDYIIGDQELDGYGTLKLSNGFKDPSLVRETLSYEIARKYFPASQANYVNVYVNGNLIGLYTSVQDVDKHFLRTNFNSNENARIKGELNPGAMPGQMGGVWEYFGTDSTNYFGKYVLETDFGWLQLIGFLDTLSNHNEYIDQVLNIDRHLWFLAFSNVLVNLDGPINNPQNYYIYLDDENRFNPIPWDLNMSFGGFKMLENGGMQNTNQLQTFNPFNNLTSNDHPIINKILSNDTYSKIYVAHYKTILEENFSNGWYETRTLEIQDIIDADVQADPNKLYTYSNFISNVNSSVGGGPNATIGLTQLIESRVSYLEALSDFQAQQPEISNIDYTPETPAPGAEVWFTAEVDFTDQVFLTWRQGFTAVFDKTEMFDDGMHNDGTAGDGVFGASIIVGNAGMQYYIYAENDDAVAFSPEKAEYEFYTLSVTSDMVINEFMADNETTVTDQDGDYDDWIEFYNNGSETINLEGLYLSDDAAQLDQWIFPDTSIAAGGYLIVWADDDGDQEGLHANFKLSKSGEAIILSDANLQVLDEISFGEQVTDTTTGRFPNGTGDFMLMPPTFGYENSLSTAINYDVLVINEFLADNESVVMDQDGEYDPWIEIYNNGTEGLAMLGTYLSNDASLPGMWAFPDVTIAAGEYLIVWADNDVAQEGLHANFILAQTGETILFSDPDLNIVDEYTYGDQISDISTGRYPNGTGDFIAMPPTFGTENTTFSTGQYEGLVINEFMADNETTVTDQDGEYDDWIELYNNGDVELPMLGVYLSDDVTEPNMWAFPDTTIAAGGYLVIWADEDDGQEGLHANFKLSKSGETIILSEPSLAVVDEVSFGEQVTDTTTGRFPNGTGEFELMQPTFGMENISFYTAIDDVAQVSILSMNAFPNPFPNNLRIAFELENPSSVSVELQNMLGQKVNIVNAEYYSSGKHELTIETSGLSKGIWICRITTDGESKTIKLLKTGE